MSDKKFDSSNHHGEWFNLGQEGIDEIKEKYSIDFNIKSPKNSAIEKPYQPKKGSIIESIYCLVRTNAPVTISFISSSLGIYPSAVKQHVRELDKRGLVLYSRADEKVSM